MLILAVLCTIVIGWLFGGRLSRFESAELKWLPIPLAALLLQGLLPFLPGGSGAPVVGSYALLLIFLWRNRHLKKTALFAAFGSISNALVILANGFRMPVSTHALDVLTPAGISKLASGSIPMYTLANEQTRFLFLGDVFYLPLPILGGFASIGDILLSLGLFFCILKIMSPGRLPDCLTKG